VAIAVHHALVDQDAIGRHQILDQLRIGGPGRGGRRLRAYDAGTSEDERGRGPAHEHSTPTDAFHGVFLPEFRRGRSAVLLPRESA